MKRWFVLLVAALLLTACAPAASTIGAAPTPTPAADETWNDTCELFLQVLEDLWNTDPALSADVTVLGLDLSEAPGGLNKAQKEEVASRFGAAHGVEVVQGTWQELADAGFIDAENLYWEDGCLFTIALAGEAGCGMPDSSLVFDATKWRSGLGAIFWTDCHATYEDGGWAYEVGGFAIS